MPWTALTESRLDAVEGYLQAQVAGPAAGVVLTDQDAADGAALDAGLRALDDALRGGEPSPGRPLEPGEIHSLTAVLDQPAYPALRLHVRRMGLAELAARLTPEDPALMLVYGTLREHEPTFQGEEVPAVRTVATRVRLPGWLYDVGEYPGAVLERSALRPGAAAQARFVADLVRIGLDRPLEQALADFDAYEDTAAGAGLGLYRRAFVPVPGVAGVSGAWVYEWTGPLAGMRRIDSGEWSSGA
jgi:gamma-glutamylcyclotransferase (GGCT)/AIG2-like uncharacterized protein YtfP